MCNKDDEIINVYRGNENPREVKLSDFRAEFGKYMQSDNLNFLFGSGCSSFYEGKVQLGINTMAGLYSEFKNKHEDFKICGKKLDDPDFENNLERLLDILISLKEVNEIVKISNDKNQDPENQINIILKFIHEKIKKNTHNEKVIDLYKQFYIRTASKSRKNPINIVTTNYDLYNELALDSLRYYYNDGFSGTFERQFNPLTYNYIYANNMKLEKNIWNRVDNFYNIFKIHGSISWEKKGTEIYEKDPHLIENDSVMIYPTPLKDRSTLMVPYSDLFRIFKNQLSKPNSILITLGYSFGDDHINRVIYDCLAVPTFKLIIFGEAKEESNIYKLLKIHDPRVTVVNSKDKIHYFKNFIKKIMPEPLIDARENQNIRETIKKVGQILQEGSKQEDSKQEGSIQDEQ